MIESNEFKNIFECLINQALKFFNWLKKLNINNFLKMLFKKNQKYI
jgi:hypothetical protein